MAPSISQQAAPVALAATPITKATANPSPTNRTSGQHEPVFSLVQPYENFPKEIVDRTVWKREDFINNPEKWVRHWTDAEIAEIEEYTLKFDKTGLPLTDITKEHFPLPSVSALLASVKEDTTNGKGFVLFKGFPVERWGLRLSAIAYLGIGSHIGYPVSQNSRGHILGHVKDLGEDSTQIDKVRIYRTNARQFFHSDDCDIVGLLCIANALSGGESDISSSHNVFNVLQRTRPDVVRTLATPNWYFDRKGEFSRGQKEFIRGAVIYYHDGRVYTKWDPYFVRSLTRFSDAGIVPALSPAQLEAIQVLEDTCLQEALHMVLDIGDIQFVTNNYMFHARSSYTDYAPPAPRRHLMRLWLSTPESEGGWKLPFHDSEKKRRGGIQVDDTPANTPIDAE